MSFLKNLKKTETFKLFKRVFIKENAVVCQLLGICSALAVSNTMVNALTMGLGVIFVTVLTSVVISMMRKVIPSEYRIITYMIVISALVIFVDQFLKAYFPEISKALGPYVGLIITNCIIMGRQEAFASQNSVGMSIVDALGNGIAYTKTLLVIAFFREIFAFGTLLNYNIVPKGFEKCIVMAMAPGAFFILALYIWVFKTIAKIPPEK